MTCAIDSLRDPKFRNPGCLLRGLKDLGLAALSRLKNSKTPLSLGAAQLQSRDRRECPMGQRPTDGDENGGPVR